MTVPKGILSCPWCYSDAMELMVVYRRGHKIRISDFAHLNGVAFVRGEPVRCDSCSSLLKLSELLEFNEGENNE